MTRTYFLIATLLSISANALAGHIGFPNDREEIYQWCVTIDPNELDELESELELAELTDEEIEIRIEEATEFDDLQYVSCILSLQAFIKGVETASKKSGLNHPKLCDETDIGAFLLNEAKGLESFDEIAWKYLYGRCSK